MKKINEILEKIKNNEQLCYIHLNDGEISIIKDSNAVAARGDQKGSPELSTKLMECLKHEQYNFYKGIPCKHCSTRDSYEYAIKYVNPDYEYLTSAVLFTNRNWKLVIDTLPIVLDDKKIIWVSGDDQDLNNLEYETSLICFDRIVTPQKNAFSEYDKIKNEYTNFTSGSVVILSCGPLARVLAKEWFELRPDCTFLDLGSVFDPYTRNVWHSCHRGTLTPCIGCN